MKYNILVLLLITLLACSKDEIVADNSNVITRTINNPNYDNVVTAMNTAVLSILELSQDIEFRRYVLDRAYQQFDGDYNVLLQTVLKEYDLQSEIAKNRSKYKLFDELLGEESYNSLLNGYAVGDEKHYFQLYIPFIEKYEVEKMPTIVLAYNDNQQNGCVADGLVFNGSSFNKIKVDESYAKQNSVLVLSINERVDTEGNVRKGIMEEQPVSEDLQTRNPEMFVGINQVKLSDKKECWLCGDGEVSVVVANVQDPITPATGDCGNQLSAWIPGKDFRALRNKDLNKWVTGNASLVGVPVGTNDRLDNDETILFILYEYDSNQDLNEVIFAPCYHSYYFRSGQGFYMVNGTDDLHYSDSDFSNPTTSNQSFTKTSGNEHVSIVYRYQ